MLGQLPPNRYPEFPQWPPFKHARIFISHRKEIIPNNRLRSKRYHTTLKFQPCGPSAHAVLIATQQKRYC